MFSNLLQRATKSVSQASESVGAFYNSVDLDKASKSMEALYNSVNLDQLQSSEPKVVMEAAPINLDQLDFTYVTERVIAMGFPRSKVATTSTKSSRNRIEDVARALKTLHGGHFMIWNLSEEAYDYSAFDDQVLEFKFPGHPAPPLGLFFKICNSIESWLEADERNVAVVHCLTGRGRTASVIACFLAWMAEEDSPLTALQRVGEKRGKEVEAIVIPSQMRYVQYFTNVLDGVRPRADPLLLRRVIVNSIPAFSPTTQGCTPYLQVFKNGKLLFASTWRDAHAAAAAAAGTSAAAPSASALALAGDGGGETAAVATGPRQYFPSDGSFSFQVDCVLQGDILIRCRHVDSDSGARVSMFRAAFHTGYIPLGIQRFSKAQTDGACQDSRFTNDFFVDLIFAPVTAEGEEESCAHSGSGGSQGYSEGVSIAAEDKAQYDAMIAAKGTFWQEISKRKERRQRRTAARNRQRQQQAQAEEAQTAGKEGEAAAATANVALSVNDRSAAFAIGGEGEGDGTTAAAAAAAPRRGSGLPPPPAFRRRGSNTSDSGAASAPQQQQQQGAVVAADAGSEEKSEAQGLGTEAVEVALTADDEPTDGAGPADANAAPADADAAADDSAVSEPSGDSGGGSGSGSDVMSEAYLQELEALERELGLEAFSSELRDMDSETGGAAAAAAPATGSGSDATAAGTATATSDTEAAPASGAGATAGAAAAAGDADDFSLSLDAEFDLGELDTALGELDMTGVEVGGLGDDDGMAELEDYLGGIDDMLQ